MMSITPSATGSTKWRPSAAQEIHHAAGRRALLAFVLALCLGASSCAYDRSRSNSARVEHETVGLLVADERGDPVAAAEVALTLDLDRDGELDTVVTDEDGTVLIEIDGPVVATVTAPGSIPEPVAISPRDRVVSIRLWDRVGPTGIERHSLHFGGDVMLGRRYLAADSSTTPVVDEATARAVVDDLAPVSRAADWTVVNLETVVGSFDDDAALDAKRFLLQSTPHVTSALDEMGVDVVTLGNNHAYDWGEEGIESTLDALDQAGIGHVGAGRSASEALAGRIDQIGELSIGTLSVTTVNGSFVNDQLPPGIETAPADLDPSDAWQYEERTFGFDTGEDDTTIPEASRRIGDVWSLFEDAEQSLGPEKVGEAWNALTEVYPELQDWVARRGHGGAAPYDGERIEAEINRLRADGADMVIVQVHGGFQFAEVASGFMSTVAHRMVDAGADMVVAHHPHVLQGLEWYNGKLISYSLGNLVFDQEFLSTFPSMILRVITEGPEVMEVRLLPLIIDRYRPVPAVGVTARTVLRTVDLRSALQATSARVDGLKVGTVLDESDDGASGRAWVHFERNSGLVGTGREATVIAVPLDSQGRATLPPCALVRTDRIADDVQIGVDLLDWGSFDDDTADDRRLRPFNWRVSRQRETWSLVAGSSGDPFDTALEIRSDPNSSTGTQIRSRIDIRPQRLYNVEHEPVDGIARYEIVLDVKRTRGESPALRVATFDFDDTDPTTDPNTRRVADHSIVLQSDADGEWHTEFIELPAELFAPHAGGAIPNTATLLIDVPPSLGGMVAIDNVRVIEWRNRPSTDVAAWVDADMVRGRSDAVVDLTVLEC